jgi:hypothetical protein
MGMMSVLESVVADIIQNNPLVVKRWVAGEPGTWGFLAGKAVLATKEKLGRKLCQSERRVVWGLLWAQLQVIAQQNNLIND